MNKLSQLVISMCLSVILCCLVSCKDNPSDPETTLYEYSRPVETDDGWDTGTLSSVGMEEERFENLVRQIDIGLYTDVHSIVVIRDGILVFEAYWPGHDFGFTSPGYHGAYVDFDRDTRQNTHSATKSITSALVGITIDRGLIENAQGIIFDYLPQTYQTWMNDGREVITIEHCLMMASGLEWNEWDVQVTSDDADLVQFNRSYDPLQYLLSKPLVTQPGSSFYYNGGTVDLLGQVIEYAAEVDLQWFSSKYLFEPLGITNYHWSVLYPSNMVCCHGDIYITPRDLAKFGRLFLDEGRWNGSQVISESWIAESTQNHIDPGVTWENGYGYLWWLRNFEVGQQHYESFKAMGWGGQEIFVFEDLDLVVVFTGSNYTTYVPCDEIVREFILPSIEN